MAIQEFPLAREQVTAAWVERCLQRAGAAEAQIREISIESLPEVGQTADVFVIVPEYANRAAPELPRSLFAKVAPTDRSHRVQVHDLGLYARELSFYRDFEMDPGIELPVIYFASIAPDTGHFFILMENLADALNPGDMWHAVADDVEAAVVALAKFHAHWWQHPRVLTSRWLAKNDALSHFEHEVAPMLPTLSNLLRRKFGRHYTDYLRYAVEHLAHGWQRAWERDLIAGTTLLHGDYHPKELFFSRDAERRVVATDWQATCLGSPGVDLHRVLLAGLTFEQMSEHQARLQALYHESLAGHGVAVDYEALVDDTRRSMLLAVRNWLFSVAFTDNEVLERSAENAGVDYRERIFEDFSRALELNRIHELLDG